MFSVFFSVLSLEMFLTCSFFSILIFNTINILNEKPRFEKNIAINASVTDGQR